MKRASPTLMACLVVMALTLIALAGAAHEVGWRNLWLTSEQRGRLLIEHQQPAEAAVAFRDPLWRGIALFRAGDFKTAASALSNVQNAPGFYDEGNALVMLGRYRDAIASYGRALNLRPGWPDAIVNRDIARARALRVETNGGDMDDTEPGATDIVFDKTKPGGRDTTVERATAQMSDEAIRAIWLKRVQTRPADFLRARFAYQLQSTPVAAGNEPTRR